MNINVDSLLQSRFFYFAVKSIALNWSNRYLCIFVIRYSDWIFCNPCNSRNCALNKRLVSTEISP